MLLLKKGRFYTMMNKKVIEEIEKSLTSEFIRYYSRHLGKSARKRLLGTLLFNLHEIRKLHKNLDPFVLVGLEQCMNRISDELLEDAYSHFFGNLYQIESSLHYRNYSRLQKQLDWTINDLYVMHAQILRGSPLDDSLSSAFFDRLKGLVTTDCSLIDGKNAQFFKLALINLCMLNSVLIDYINRIGGGYKDVAENYLGSSFRTLKRVYLDTEKEEENISLLLYVYLTIKKSSVILNENVDMMEKESKNLIEKYGSKISDLRDYDLILGLCNIHGLNREEFRQLFKSVFEKLSTKNVDWRNRPFYIRMLTFYLQEIDIYDQISLNIRPEFTPLNVDEVLNKLFREFLSRQNEVEINNNDIKKLMSYYDSQLRQKLMEILLRSDHISEHAKERLKEEAKKPHTGYEISDLEVRVGRDFETIMACLPIKSAKEIKTTSVPVSYVYQIIRPFNQLYGKCVVVFVTAKRCSEPLANYIKQLRSLHELPVAVIEENYLCKLLKFYDMLN